MDPQHQAVRAATLQLRRAHYWGRERRAQIAYLDDVAELTREVAVILTQAGITWADAARLVDRTDDTMARMLLMDPAGTLEYALCSAVAEARGRL